MKSNKGVSFNDRQLAGRVRNLALNHLEKVLKEDFKDKEYQRQMMLKLASSLLPRLSELSGPDGEPLFNEKQKQKGEKAIEEFLNDDTEQGE